MRIVTSPASPMKTRPTGHIVTPAELAEALRLLEIARNTPDVRVSGTGPTWAERAWHDLQMYVDSLATKRGLPPERSWGLRARDGMIIADATWDGTGGRLS